MTQLNTPPADIRDTTAGRPTDNPANGPAAAALLSCGIGCFALGVLAVAADGSPRLSSALNFYNPTGALSGVTTAAVAFWLICWAVLAARWKHKSVAFGRISIAGFLLLSVGSVLMITPFGDLLLGR